MVIVLVDFFSLFMGYKIDISDFGKFLQNEYMVEERMRKAVTH